MKSKPGVCHQVGVPIATAGRAGNVEPAFNIVEPDLLESGLPGIPSSGGDIDGAVPFQGLSNCFILVPSPSNTVRLEFLGISLLSPPTLPLTGKSVPEVTWCDPTTPPGPVQRALERP